MPVTYKISFSPRWTKTMIMVLILLSVVVTLTTSYIRETPLTVQYLPWQFVTVPCSYFYVKGDTVFNYSEDPICVFPSLVNLAKLILFSVFNMICDSVTISRVRKVQKVFIKSQGSEAKNQKTELGFIKQSFSQSLISILFILTIATIQFIEPNQFVVFLFGTLLLSLVHSLNGYLERPESLFSNVILQCSNIKIQLDNPQSPLAKQNVQRICGFIGLKIVQVLNSCICVLLTTTPFLCSTFLDFSNSQWFLLLPNLPISTHSSSLRRTVCQG